MSRAYKCDRCGELYDKPDKIDRAAMNGNPIDIVKICSHYDPVFSLKDYDLCPNCANSFANWLMMDDE